MKRFSLDFYGLILRNECIACFTIKEDLKVFVS